MGHKAIHELFAVPSRVLLRNETVRECDIGERVEVRVGFKINHCIAQCIDERAIIYRDAISIDNRQCHPAAASIIWWSRASDVGERTSNDTHVLTNRITMDV